MTGNLIVDHLIILVPAALGLGFLLGWLGCLIQTQVTSEYKKNSSKIPLIVWTVIEAITSILEIEIKEYTAVIISVVFVGICWVVYLFGKRGYK